MINTEKIEEAKKAIKREKKPVIVKAQSNDFNRRILEQANFDVLLSPESGSKKDTLRQIDSGLNEILVDIAKRKKISIGINIHEIKLLEKKEKANRLAKIRQNLMLCKKAGVRILAINYKDKMGTQSILATLGASTSQAREATSFK